MLNFGAPSKAPIPKAFVFILVGFLLASIASTVFGGLAAMAENWDMEGILTFVACFLPLLSIAAAVALMAKRWRPLVSILTSVDTTAGLMDSIGGVNGLEGMLSAFGFGGEVLEGEASTASEPVAPAEIIERQEKT